jgi:hypothetical protein
MAYRSKIRMSIGWIYPIGILISYIIGIAEWAIRANYIRKGSDINQIPVFTYSIVALFFAALGIVQLIKYRNWIYLVLGLLIGLATFQVPFAMEHDTGVFKFTYLLTIVVFILFVVFNWNTIYSHERFEANSRRLFRLASERIFETGDGYTGRHYMAGQIKSGKDELLGFVRFFHGNYITRPFYYENYVSLAFSMNTSLMVIDMPSAVSHIILEYNGNIKVKISEQDYRDYKERLSFDQLCTSMADVFVRFLDYYQKGLESRIVTELKSAK